MGFRAITPPLLETEGRHGGLWLFGIWNIILVKIPKPKNFAPSARFYYAFGIRFMFLAPETIILAHVFQFFRTCGKRVGGRRNTMKTFKWTRISAYTPPRITIHTLHASERSRNHVRRTERRKIHEFH